MHRAFQRMLLATAELPGNRRAQREQDEAHRARLPDAHLPVVFLIFVEHWKANWLSAISGYVGIGVIGEFARLCFGRSRRGNVRWPFTVNRWLCTFRIEFSRNRVENSDSSRAE